jgi:hypothetical protein
VCTIPTQARREFPTRGVPPQRDSGRRVGFVCGEFVGRSLSRGPYEYGGTIAVLGLRGSTDHVLHVVVLIVLQGDVRVLMYVKYHFYAVNSCIK